MDNNIFKFSISPVSIFGIFILFCIGLITMINYSEKKEKPISNFDTAVNFVIKNEGGYVVDPDDNGGATNFGITKKSYPHLDISSLTIKDIKEIYRKDFWENSFVSKINNPIIASKLMDISVLSGIEQASLIFQRSIIAAGHQIILDGDVGEQTMEAFNLIKNTEGFIWLIRAESISFFMKIIANDRTQQKFLLGWIARVFRQPKL